MIKSNFIPAKDALILWKPRKHQEDFNLKVILHKTYLDNESKWSEYPKSSGCAFVEWKGWNEAQMMGECMRILFSERVTNKEKIKEAFYQFGKIKELVNIRSLYHSLYFFNDMPRESLEMSIFGWDFCERD
jgi:hypothetical protein